MTPLNDLIDQYLLGQLDEVTRADFLDRLSKDPNLAAEVKKRQSIITGLEDLSHQKMKKQIQTIRQGMSQQEAASTEAKVVQKSLSRYLGIAAAVLVICIAAFWLFPKSKINQNPEQLFAQNFKLYEAAFNTRNQDVDQQLIQAVDYYSNNNFTAAIPLLEQALKEQADNANLQLALGNAFLANDQISSAIPQFQAIIQRNDLLYQDRARWYLALAYLKNNQLVDCVKQLQSLSQDAKADYHQEAMVLLQQIGKVQGSVSALPQKVLKPSHFPTSPAPSYSIDFV